VAIVAVVGTGAIVAGHVLLRATWWRYEWEWAWFQYHFGTILLAPFTAGVACWWGARWTRARTMIGTSPRAARAVAGIVAWVWVPTVGAYVAGLVAVSITVATTTRQVPPLRMVLSLPPALALLAAAAAVGMATGYRWASRALAPLVGVATFLVLLAGYMAGPVHTVKVGGATASLLGLAPRPEVQAGQVLLFSGVAAVAVVWVARIGPHRGLPTMVRVGGALALLASGVGVLHLAGNQEFDKVSVPMVCEGSGPEICVDAGYRSTIPQLRANFSPSFRSLEAASLPAPDALVQLPMEDKPEATVFDPVTMLRYPYGGDGYLASGYIPDDCDIFANDRAGDGFEGISLYLQRTYRQTEVTVTPEERFLLHLAYEHLVECRP
jgi:hypothetical protein